MDALISFIISFSGAFLTLLFVLAIYFVSNYLMKRQMRGKPDSALIRQMTLFGIGIIGFIAIILALPMSDSLRGQISSLMGIVISAVFALSSATFIGNMLAGILLRAINNFRSGDFIEVQDHFGRVSERGLFHTELQTVNRNLITLPNLYLATHPVNVIRSSGTFISGEVSLGYDVSRKQIEECLIEAAKRAGLKDPFVHITSLGDFSVVYKIHGLLEDVKKVLTTQSLLNKMILDTLHEESIEIVSPNFMNQRPIGDTLFIPKKEKIKEKDAEEVQHVEAMIFDKAEKAENLERKQARLDEVEPKIKELQAQIKEEKDEETLAKLQEKLDKLKSIQERMLRNLEEEHGNLNK